jgi:hypothetical protein
MDQVQTVDAPDPGRIPGSVRGEFGPQQMDKSTVDELAALEAKINAQSEPKPELPLNVQTLREVKQEPPKETRGVPVPEGVQVPDKFKTPEGNLDPEKVEKSLVNLQHYLNLEKEASRINQPPQPQYAPQQFQPQFVPQPIPQWAPQVPLEQRVNEDIQRDPGTTVVNLGRAVLAEAQQATEVRFKELSRKLELMEISQRDPGVFTKEGAQKIEQTLKENPWLWNSPTPFASAYRMNGPISPVAPQAAAPQRKAAPILPGGQAPSIPTGTSVASEADLRRHLSERMPNNPMGQAEYLEKIIEELDKQRRG